MNKTFLAGVDIGGSHITAALIDPDTGAVLPDTWQRNSVPAGGTAEAILEAWSAVIAASYAQQPQLPARLGIAMPGPFDYEEGICLIRDQHKYESLYGLNVKDLLAERLGIPRDAIRLTNDAACFLQGEVYAGAAREHNRVVGLTLGTGLGSATYVDHQVEDAAWWNSPFKEGIAEDYLSSRWFVQRCEELTGETVPHVKQLLAVAGRAVLQTIFDEFGQNLGGFLLQATRRQQPADVIVLGGNIAQAYGWFEGSLLDCLQQGGNHTPVRPAQLGEQAALIGAATAGLQWPAGKLTV